MFGTGGIIYEICLAGATGSYPARGVSIFGEHLAGVPNSFFFAIRGTDFLDAGYALRPLTIITTSVVMKDVANEAIELLREKVDTLIMIANDRLLQASCLENPYVYFCLKTIHTQYYRNVTSPTAVTRRFPFIVVAVELAARYLVDFRHFGVCEQQKVESVVAICFL